MPALVICHECAGEQLRECGCGSRELLTTTCSHHPDGELFVNEPCPCEQTIRVMFHWECDHSILSDETIEEIITYTSAGRCKPGAIECLNAQIDVMIFVIGCLAHEVDRSSSSSQSSSVDSSQGAGWSWADSQSTAADSSIDASADKSENSNTGSATDATTGSSYSFGYTWEREDENIDRFSKDREDSTAQGSGSSESRSSDESRDVSASWPDDENEIYGTSVDYTHMTTESREMQFKFGLDDGAILVQPFGIGIDLSPDLGAGRDVDLDNEIDFSRAHDVTRTTYYDLAQSRSTSRSSAADQSVSDGSDFAYSFSNEDEFGFTKNRSEQEGHSESSSNGEGAASSQGQAVSLARSKSLGYSQTTSEGESRNISTSSGSSGSVNSSISVAYGQKAQHWQMILDLTIALRDKAEARRHKRRGFTICSGPILGDTSGHCEEVELCCDDIRPYGIPPDSE